MLPLVPFSLLALGFVIGLQHAFEADHLAAVTSLVSRKSNLKDISRFGALWGAGHAAALLIIVALAIGSPFALSPRFYPVLELAVGVMLVTLGLRLLHRLHRDRIHIHVHQHHEGLAHLHAHSHRHDSVAHQASPHEHGHRTLREQWGTVLVGLLHGAAGSGALIAYVAGRRDSPATGLLYVVLFGCGSIVGMVLLSLAIALPLATTARTLTSLNRGLQLAVAFATVALGLQRLGAFGPAVLGHLSI